MQSFFTISGTIRRIESHGDCSLIMSVTDTGGGPVNLIIDSPTYVVDMENLQVGDPVLAYCDSSAPAPLIYPPQYSPVLLVKPEEGHSYDLDTYGDRLINSKGSLRLQIAADTEVILPNGLDYPGALNGKMLFVDYKASTRSIPALTTPELVVVFCSSI